MDNLLKELATTLEKTTNGAESLVTYLKEVSPDIYHTLVREHAIYSMCSSLQVIIVIMLLVFICVFLVSGFMYLNDELAHGATVKIIKVSLYSLLGLVGALVVTIILSNLLAPNVHILLRLFRG